MAVAFSDIEEAARQHGDANLYTQYCLSHPLTQCTGIEVYVKYENRQHTGAFKVRGALTKRLTLSEEQRSRGVVGMSAGNHAQGVAYSAKRLGIPALRSSCRIAHHSRRCAILQTLVQRLLLKDRPLMRQHNTPKCWQVPKDSLYPSLQRQARDFWAGNNCAGSAS